jgi:hypothetical protein
MRDVAGLGSADRAKAGRRAADMGEDWRTAVDRKRCEVAGAAACLRRLGRMMEAIAGDTGLGGREVEVETEGGDVEVHKAYVGWVWRRPPSRGSKSDGLPGRKRVRADWLRGGPCSEFVFIDALGIWFMVVIIWIFYLT